MTVTSLHPMTLDEASEVLAGIGYNDTWTPEQFLAAVPTDMRELVFDALLVTRAALIAAKQALELNGERQAAGPLDRKEQIARLVALAHALTDQPAMAASLLVMASAHILMAEVGPQRTAQALGEMVGGVAAGLHDTFGAAERSN